MRRLSIIPTLFFLVCLGYASATTITASSTADAFGRPVTGKLCFQPVDATNTPTGFRVGAVQVTSSPVCGIISNGALQSGLTLAGTPAGIYYHITTADRTTGNILRDYGMTQITGTSWTLDTYDPSTAVLPVTALAVGTVTTVAPGTPATVSLSGSSPVLLNVSIPQGATGPIGPAGPTVDATARASAAAAQATASAAQPAIPNLSVDSSGNMSTTKNISASNVAASVNGTLFANASPFGAVCNGVTTGVDGPAIRAALAVAKTTHQSVQLPPGVCVMDAGVTIDGNSVSVPPYQSGIRVYGAGQSATALYFPSVTSGAAINITQFGGDGLHLHDLAIIGPGAGTADGIYNVWSNNLAIDHVAVTGFYNGIHLNGCGASCLIDTVSSSYNLNDGIFLDATSDASVTNSFLVYNGGDDIYLYNGDHALLSNNTIGVVSGTAVASSYQGNYGIHVVGATGTTAVANRIEGDVFVGSLSNPVYSWTVSGATWLGGVATYTTSATIYFATGDLIYISGASPSGYNISAYANGANCVATVTGPTTFTCPVASNPGTFSSSGTVTLIAGSHGVLDSSGNDVYLGNYFTHTDVRPASAGNNFTRIDSYPSSVTPTGSGSYINGGTNSTPQTMLTAYDASTGQSPSVSMGVTANGIDSAFVGSLNNIPFSIKQNGIAVATATASLFTVNYGLTVTGSTILNGSVTANSTATFSSGLTLGNTLFMPTGIEIRSTTALSTDNTYTGFPNHTWRDPSNSFVQYAKLMAGVYPQLQLIEPTYGNIVKCQMIGNTGGACGTQTAVSMFLLSNNTKGLGLDISGNVGIGSSSAVTSNKLYWDVNGLEHNSIGTAIASATTIAPLAKITHITGTTAIATITAPTGCTTSGWSCQITLIPDGLWTTTTAGNIAIASTVVVSKAEIMTYDPATAKWYPSY